MPSKPYFPLYFSDFKKDTSRLTNEECYSYLLLLNDYWDTEKPLPNDPKVLQKVSNLAPKKFQKVWPKLITFFTLKDGYFYHKRIEEEIKNYYEKALKRSSKAKNAANSRWKKECLEQCSEHSLEDCSKVCPSDAISSSNTSINISCSSSLGCSTTPRARDPDPPDKKTKTEKKSDPPVFQIYFDALVPRFASLGFGGIKKKTSAMFRAWAEEEVSLEDIEHTIKFCEERGDRVYDPGYYANIVIDFCRERKKFGSYQARGSPDTKKKNTEEEVQKILKHRQEWYEREARECG